MGGGPSNGMTREGSPPGMVNPYSLGQCSPSDLSSLRNSVHHHMGGSPGAMSHHHHHPHHHHPLPTGGGGSHFTGLGGLNEFLWSAGLAGVPHGAPGLFTTPSILSAFPALAAAGWPPKSNTPSAAATAAQTLFAQYMMASSHPAVFPFDLSAKTNSSVSGLNLSPSNRSRSDSRSPPSHNSSEFAADGKISPVVEEAIDLAKGSSRRKIESANGNEYGLTFHGKITSAGRQESVSILRERAAKHLLNGHSPTVKN